MVCACAEIFTSGFVHISLSKKKKKYDTYVEVRTSYVHTGRSKAGVGGKGEESTHLIIHINIYCDLVTHDRFPAVPGNSNQQAAAGTATD